MSVSLPRLTPDQWLYLSLAYTGLTLIVIAYMIFRKPPSERWPRIPTPEELGPDYAPMYTFRERFILIGKTLAWSVPLYLGVKYWFQPWMHALTTSSVCRHYGPFNDLQLVMILFAVVPLLALAIHTAATGLPHAYRVWRLGQLPLPGEKTISKTKYCFGIKARALAVTQVIGLLGLLGLTTYTGLLGYRAGKYFKPCMESSTSTNTRPGTAPTSPR